MKELFRLNCSAFFDCLFCVGLLAAKPVDNRYKSEYNANPVETIGHGINDVLEGPLEAVCYRSKDALEIHG
jgi:hypothetical protein